MTERSRGVHRKVPHLLKNWERVAEEIRRHRRVTIFLDFDGTLVAIMPRPELVRLTRSARKILQRLARHPRATLAVVSGRRRGELLKHIGVRGIHYFGLYGWESNAKSTLPASVRTALAKVRKKLNPLLKTYPTLWVENKRSSLSVHLLEVPPGRQPHVRRELKKVLALFRKTLHAVGNIRDVEILPRSIPGKGIAVKRFLAQPAHRKSFPLYFGDDYSDESGFVAVRRGASVHVGHPRPTQAKFTVKTPEEVSIALKKLEEVLSEDRSHKKRKQA